MQAASIELPPAGHRAGMRHETEPVPNLATGDPSIDEHDRVAEKHVAARRKRGERPLATHSDECRLRRPPAMSWLQETRPAHDRHGRGPLEDAAGTEQVRPLPIARKPRAQPREPAENVWFKSSPKFGRPMCHQSGRQCCGASRHRVNRTSFSIRGNIMLHAAGGVISADPHGCRPAGSTAAVRVIATTPTTPSRRRDPGRSVASPRRGTPAP